jgi:hypothetical protein
MDSFCVNSCPFLLLRQLVEYLNLCEAINASLCERKPAVSRWQGIMHYLLSAQIEVTERTLNAPEQRTYERVLIGP